MWGMFIHFQDTVTTIAIMKSVSLGFWFLATSSEKKQLILLKIADINLILKLLNSKGPYYVRSSNNTNQSTF